MEIGIRDWRRSDFERIGSLWLRAYEEVRLPDAPLKRGADRALREWLSDRFSDR